MPPTGCPARSTSARGRRSRPMRGAIAASTRRSALAGLERPVSFPRPRHSAARAVPAATAASLDHVGELARRTPPRSAVFMALADPTRRLSTLASDRRPDACDDRAHGADHRRRRRDRRAHRRAPLAGGPCRAAGGPGPRPRGGDPGRRPRGRRPCAARRAGARVRARGRDGTHRDADPRGEDAPHRGGAPAAGLAARPGRLGDLDAERPGGGQDRRAGRRAADGGRVPLVRRLLRPARARRLQRTGKSQGRRAGRPAHLPDHRPGAGPVRLPSHGGDGEHPRPPVGQAAPRHRVLRDRHGRRGRRRPPGGRERPPHAVRPRRRGTGRRGCARRGRAARRRLRPAEPPRRRERVRRRRARRGTRIGRTGAALS